MSENRVWKELNKVKYVQHLMTYLIGLCTQMLISYHNTDKQINWNVIKAMGKGILVKRKVLSKIVCFTINLQKKLL